MKKSINAWSVPKDLNFKEMFEIIAGAGFEGIELNVDAENSSNHSLTMTTDKETFKEIKELSEEYKLKIPSISTSLTGGKLASQDKATRELGKDLIRKQLECAAELGADGILTVPGGKAEGLSFAEGYENSLNTILELKSEIESTKINVGLENVWNGFFVSPFDMKNFIDEIGSPYVGAYFDVGNVIAFSDAEDWIEILDNRIQKIHVKDFKRNGGINRGGCFVNLLEGNVNWSKVIPALRKIGFDGYLTAELDIMGQCPEYLYTITSKALDIIIGM